MGFFFSDIKKIFLLLLFFLILFIGLFFFTFLAMIILPNDYKAYPEDSFENMQKFSNNNNFSFPYLFDYKQEVAKSYGAVCTPDFFCFDNRNKLFYRGRLDNVKFKANFLDREKSIINAYEKMIKENSIVTKQFSSMGCSIKWR